MKTKICFTALVALTASAAFGQFSENWDSYANNTSMHGVGGWKGWDNSAGATAFTSNAQSTSAPNSIKIDGGTDLVHLFSPTSGQWVWKMKQFIPSSFTAATDKTYFILLNQYNDLGPYNWSVQLFFDGATSTVNEDLYTNPPTALTMVRNAWIPIRCEIDLTADAVTEKYNGATLWSHTWKSSATSTLAIAACDIYANNASSVYYDDILLLPNPYNVNPSSYSSLFGTPFGGNLASLNASDNDKLVILNDENDPNAEVQFQGTSLDKNPVSVSTVVEESSSRTDIGLYTDLFNVSTNSYGQVHFAVSTLVDQTYTTTVTANTQNYFSAAGLIKARVKAIPTADIDAGDGWTVSYDQLRFSLAP